MSNWVGLAESEENTRLTSQKQFVLQSKDHNRLQCFQFKQGFRRDPRFGLQKYLLHSHVSEWRQIKTLWQHNTLITLPSMTEIASVAKYMLVTQILKREQNLCVCVMIIEPSFPSLMTTVFFCIYAADILSKYSTSWYFAIYMQSASKYSKPLIRI